MNKLNVYVGCALAYSPEEYKQQIYLLKSELAKLSWINLFEFCVPPAGSAQSDFDSGVIYKNDIIDGVEKSHVVIGDLTYPSTGLGGELMSSMKDNTRTMMFAKEGVVVSKLWIGAPVYNTHASFRWYEENIICLLPSIVDELKKIHELLEISNSLDS